MNIMNKINIIVKKYVCDPRKRGREVTIHDDDIMLVSYPKSGNTWTRFLIGNLISKEPVNFINIENIVPDIYKNRDFELLKLPSPRIMKSHEYFNPQYKKIIYIVRDPRSVAVSYFHHLKKFNEFSSNYEFINFVKRFINGEIDQYASWNDNVTSWINTIGQNRDNFLLLRYEDLKEDTFLELKKVVDFLNLNCDEDKIKEAIELSSIEEMKKLEDVQKEDSKILKGSNTNQRFVRKGSLNEWKDYFDDQSKKIFYEKFGKNMQILNYDIEELQ